MISKIGIANLTFSHLGMKPIVSLTEDIPQVNTFNAAYDPSLDDLYEEALWAFATVQKPLTPVSNEIVGWKYVYAYPANIAKAWKVYNTSTVDKKDEQDFETYFIVEENKRVICCNTSEALADVTYKVTDTNIFSPKFAFALSYKIASIIAHDLTGDLEKGSTMLQVYQLVLDDAKRLSFTEKKKFPKFTSAQQEARG